MSNFWNSLRIGSKVEEYFCFIFDHILEFSCCFWITNMVSNSGLQDPCGSTRSSLHSRLFQYHVRHQMEICIADFHIELFPKLAWICRHLVRYFLHYFVWNKQWSQNCFVFLYKFYKLEQAEIFQAWSKPELRKIDPG